jgi:hypothetical protein
VSKVVTDYGTTVTSLLPHDYSKAELEAAMKLVFTAWNAVTIDNWNQNTEQEQLVLSTVAEERAALLMLKRLIKRKKKKFSQYSWGIGNHWVRETEDGGLVFGCEARGKTEH